MIPAALWKPLAGAVAVGLLLWGLVHAWNTHNASQQAIGASQERAVWVQRLDDQKRDAATLLLAEQTKVARLEAEARTARQAQDLKDAENAKTRSDMQARLAAAAAGNGGRLRDPNATPARCGVGSAGTPAATASGTSARDGDGAEAGGLFSAAATGLLQRITSEADAVNDAYASSRADARALRALCSVQ